MPAQNTPAETQQSSNDFVTQYNPEPQRDVVPEIFVIGLLAVLLLAVIGYSFYSTHGDYEKAKDLLDKLLPALTGLVGSALGFCFGSKPRGG